jgi:hypothetical protein
MTNETPTPPTTPEAARATLQARIADKDWGAKLLASDPATRSDWENLSKIASGDSEAIAAAKATAASATPSDDKPKTMQELAAAAAAEEHGRRVTSYLASVREKFEVSAGVEDELRTGKPVTQAEFDAVKKLRTQRMNDPDWSARLLKGDPEAARESFLMSMVLSSNIREEEAA